nr:MAG TPA: hypothetical protein [Bacteriophage sp.]
MKKFNERVRSIKKEKRGEQIVHHLKTVFK